MSRDWTPRELYAVEEDNIRNGRGSLWDFMKGATWHINGENYPLCSEETLARRQEYPLLGRLYEAYDELYAFLSQVHGGMDLLARHEAELDTYLRTGQGDKDSALIRWFEGRLDEHFYYREHNDALLMDFIQNEAGKLEHNQLVIGGSEIASPVQSAPAEKYFEIYVEDPRGQFDYSIFVEGAWNANEAVEKAVEECLFAEPEHIGMIDSVAEISREEFLSATGAQPKAKSALADQIQSAQERQGRGGDSGPSKEQNLSR